MFSSLNFLAKPLLVLLVFAFIAVPVHAQSSIPFGTTSQGHIIVKAKINGVEGSFILDTGAGMTLITKAFSDQVGKLHHQDGSYTGFRATGERLVADLYDAQTLALGNFVEHNPVLTIFDVNLGPVDGLISLRSFKEQPFTIDYSSKRIIFETARSIAVLRKSGHRIPLQVEDSREKALTIFAYFTVNNSLTLQFSIDSGAGNDVYRLNSEFVKGLGIDTANASKIEIPSEFNPDYKTVIYRANVKSISAKASAEVCRQDVQASFIQGLIYDGIVSLNWIGEKISFDLKSREMIVHPLKTGHIY